jgi:hypothetical protein
MMNAKQFAAEFEARARQPKPEAPSDASGDASLGAAFRYFSFDFATDFSAPRTLLAKGGQLTFLRRGSFPGARFDMRIGGSTFPGFRPGCRVVAPFTDVTFERSTFFGSQLYTTNIGALRQKQPVNFLVSAPGCDFIEPNPLVETDGRLWPLLGDSQDLGSSSWAIFTNGLSSDVVTSANYTASNLAWFNPFGFKKLRLYIYGGPGGIGTMQSCTLIPWIRLPYGPNNAPNSAAQPIRLPLSAISVPTPINTDSAYTSVTDYNFNILDIDNPLFSHRDIANSISGEASNGSGGEMTFQLTDLVVSGGGQTSVRIAVDGIETP